MDMNERIYRWGIEGGGRELTWQNVSILCKLYLRVRNRVRSDPCDSISVLRFRQNTTTTDSYLSYDLNKVIESEREEREGRHSTSSSSRTKTYRSQTRRVPDNK